MNSVKWVMSPSGRKLMISVTAEETSSALTAATLTPFSKKYSPSALSVNSALVLMPPLLTR